MIKVTSATILSDYVIIFTFSDGIQKTIDLTPFIASSEFTKPLLDSEYFRTMKVYENGRGVYWPNGYDFCPDNLRYHVEEEIQKPLTVYDKKAGS